MPLTLGRNARERTDFSEALRLAIHEQRRRVDMTQGALADAIGADRKTISQIERHERVADVSQLARIADALGVASSELVRMAERRLESRPDAVSQDEPGKYSPGI